MSVMVTKYYSIVILFCLLLLQAVEVSDILAKPDEQLYSSITLDMYVLDQDGTKAPGDLLCNTNTITRRSFGCTAYPGNPDLEYPFNSNEENINIESDIRTIVINGGNEQVELGYLHNVTPHELDIAAGSQGNKPLASVIAQAIASRTFAYYHINLSSNIDNAANGFQVYIPFRYRQFTQAQKQRVNAALAEVFYMTANGSSAPIRAHFGSDNYGDTQDGGESYLKPVDDPISASYGQDIGTSNGGMSSKGASRWGFGHTSSRGPVAPNNPLYPHDNQGNGDFWIRWEEAFQILTHYYTGIHIRNANKYHCYAYISLEPAACHLG
ncbi:MAG TPA: hypothetical protein VGD99_21665 [Anaerolineae bacterium]